VNIPSEVTVKPTPTTIKIVAIGSGYISIKDAFDDYAKSPKRLVIPYSLSNTAISGTTKHIHLAGLIDGGYRIVYDTSFYNNTKALTAFRRAVEKWRCATGVKIEECCTPKTLCIKQAKDVEKGVLYVSFSDTVCNKLTTDTTTLGQTTAYSSKHRIGTMGIDSVKYIYNAVIRFKSHYKNGKSWYYGSPDTLKLNQFNFESVALHELGHFFRLKHVNEPTLMYYGSAADTAAKYNIVDITNDPANTGVDTVVAFSKKPIPLCAYKPLVPVSFVNCPLVPCSVATCYNPTPIGDIDVNITCNLDSGTIAEDDFGVLLMVPVIVSIEDTTDQPNFNYLWNFDGGIITSGTNTTQFGPHEVHWETAGLKTITLTINDGTNCYELSRTLFVNAQAGCAIDSMLISTSYAHPDCDSNNGIIYLDNSYLAGTTCFYYKMYKNSLEFYTGYTDFLGLTLDNLSAGTYKFDVWDNISGCFGSQTITLISQVKADATITHTYNGGSHGKIELHLKNDTATYNYAWSNGASSAKIQNLSAGNYTVTITDGDCIGIHTFTVENLNITVDDCHNCGTGPSVISPNPFTQQLNFKFIILPPTGCQAPSSSTTAQVRLYNQQGMLVSELYNELVNFNENSEITFNTNDFPPGAYWLQLIYCNKTKTWTIIKQ
jgi:hypothetical protein